MPQWIRWARELQAIGQTGLRYAGDERFAGDAFDVERYERVRELATEMFRAHLEDDFTSVDVLLAGETGDATPKIDVRGVVFDDNDSVLLVRERQDNRWTLPGGWAEVNEPPSTSVAREVEEESGYEVRVVRLLALWDRDHHEHPAHPFHIWKAFFACEVTGGRPRETLEASESQFWDVDDLPPLSTARVTSRQLKRVRDLHRDPHAPAAFD
ncbi:MAG: NUDIX hydrolase [Actinomycetota bacterium]|nr:NUDIX hydrolase [Actinomycetota bacterium]